MQLWWMHWMERYVTIRTALLLTWSNDLHTSSWWGPDLVTLVIIMYLFPLQRKWSFSLHVMCIDAKENKGIVQFFCVGFILFDHWQMKAEITKIQIFVTFSFFFNQSSLTRICVTVYYTKLVPIKRANHRDPQLESRKNYMSNV